MLQFNMDCLGLYSILMGPKMVSISELLSFAQPESGGENWAVRIRAAAISYDDQSCRKILLFLSYQPSIVP